jgi:hypothetical protein
MTRCLAGAALLVLLNGCGGSDPQPRPPGAFAGTFQVTGIHCNGGAGPPDMIARITAPYSNTWVSTDGYALSSTFTDGACTIGVPMATSYPTASSFIGGGSGGAVTCAPSPAACASLLALFFGGTACGAANNEAQSIWSFTAVPTVVGGTATVTATGGPAGYTNNCSNAGLTGPLTLTVTKK